MKEPEYKGVTLKRGSKAYELYYDKSEDAKKKLDKHLKEVFANYEQLTKR